MARALLVKEWKCPRDVACHTSGWNPPITGASASNQVLFLRDAHQSSFHQSVNLKDLFSC